jgi:hypothetical protein
MTFSFAVVVRVFVLTLLTAGAACGGADGPSPPPAAAQSAIAVAAIAAGQQTHLARAAYYASEAARYRQIAAQQRTLAATDAQRTLPTTTAAERIAKRRAAFEARAAGADQSAARLQPIVDFHTAEAAKEVVR